MSKNPKQAKQISKPVRVVCECLAKLKDKTMCTCVSYTHFETKKAGRGWRCPQCTRGKHMHGTVAAGHQREY